MAADTTRVELLKARQRWALVNEAERQALREATLEDKLEAVERLMQSIDDFGWRAELDDDEVVRERWKRLRQKLGGAPPNPTTSKPNSSGS